RAGAVAGDALGPGEWALVALVVAGDADGIDEPHLKLAGDDRRRHEPAAGDRDDALPRALLDQAPGERLGVAVQLFPGDREVLLELPDAHGPLPWPTPSRPSPPCLLPHPPGPPHPPTP